MEEPMLKMLSLSTVVAISAFGLCTAAQSQGAAAPGLAGTYRCQPEPAKCDVWGTTVSITQEGNKVSLNNDKGSFAEAKLTSNTTLSAAPPFNADGLILPDHSIQWSNGTKWVKQ
jgi:hypothetical protein